MCEYNNKVTLIGSLQILIFSLLIGCLSVFEINAAPSNEDFLTTNQQLAASPYDVELHDLWYKLAERASDDPISRLTILTKYISTHPKDSLLFQDYLTQLSWDEQHNAATYLYQGQHFSEPKLYMVRALAKSSKESGDLETALKLYTDILTDNPLDLDAQVGQFVILIMQDKAESVLENYPNLPAQTQQEIRIQRLLAQAHQALNQQPFATAILRNLLIKHPDDSVVIKETALAMAQSGMPMEAFSTFTTHKNHFDLASEQAIKSALNTYQTRLAINETQPQEQIVMARTALEFNLQYLNFLKQVNSSQSNSAIPAAHADRLTLYSVLNQHQTVVDYYAENKHLNIPIYGLNIVAGSMLAIHEPEFAIDLIDLILAVQPNNFDAVQLAYFAHLEMEEFSKAEEYLLQLLDQTNTWLYSSDSKIVRPNRRKVTVELMQALHQAYKNNNKAAIESLTELLHSAPANNEIRVNLAAIKRWSGRLNESREILNVVENSDSDYSRKTVEEIYLLLAERKYQESTELFNQLVEQNPDHDSIPHIKKELSIFNSNQILMSGEEHANEGTRFSSREDQFDISFYSQPIDYNWRLMATKSHQHAFTDQLGKATIDQYAIGINYRQEKATLQIQRIKTDNHNGKDWRFDADYKVNDFWRIGLSSQTFSDQTPVRAFAADITASSVQLNIQHQFDDRYHNGLSLSRLNFTDNNTRQEINLHADQQLFRNEHHKLFLHENIYAQKNSIAGNSPYFNPSSFYSASVALDYEGILHRHYDRTWLHGLNVNTGISQQDDFGSDPLLSIIYQHKYHFNRYTSVFAGVGYSARYYDGDEETGPWYKAGLEYLF